MPILKINKDANTFQLIENNLSELSLEVTFKSEVVFTGTLKQQTAHILSSDITTESIYQDIDYGIYFEGCRIKKS